MTRIVWGDPADRLYEYGVDQGVLYPIGQDGVPWNGLVSVEESPVGGESSQLYYDGVKRLDIVANEDYQAQLTAISTPPEFEECDGNRILAAGLFATGQRRSTFGLSYRSRIGNVNDPRLGYKLHIVWNCTASPAGRTYNTKSDKVEPNSRTWTIDSVPTPNPTNDEWFLPSHPDVFYKPTAHMVIDSTQTGYDSLAGKEKIAMVEEILYGTVSTAPRIPTQAEVIDLLDNYSNT